MDGIPNGRIKCTLANWMGVAYKIPRFKLVDCKNYVLVAIIKKHLGLDQNLYTILQAPSISFFEKKPIL